MLWISLLTYTVVAVVIVIVSDLQARNLGTVSVGTLGILQEYQVESVFFYSKLMFL